MRQFLERDSRCRGLVLIVILLLVGILAVILVEFSYAARMNLDVSSSRVADRQALFCAEAGVAAGIQGICTTRNLNALLRSDLLSGRTPVPVGETGQCLVWVSEENGRVNVNRLKSGAQPDRAAVEMVLSLIDQWNAQPGVSQPLGYGVVPATVDWVDNDDEVTYLPYVQRENEGAEDAWYAKLTPRQHCGNAPLGAISELLQVKGMTPEALNGAATGGSGVIFGLRDFLTTCGDGMIDLNQAPPEVLKALSPAMTPALVQTIIERRADEPFVNMAELRVLPGMTDDLFLFMNGTMTVSPSERCFRIRAEGAVEGALRGVEEVVKLGGERGVTIISREEF